MFEESQKNIPKFYVPCILIFFENEDCIHLSDFKTVVGTLVNSTLSEEDTGEQC